MPMPMGGLCWPGIYEAFMDAPDNMIELFHGYTYSGHPLACAAGLATIDPTETKACSNGRRRWRHWQDALHSAKGANHVIDIRNLGLVGAIEPTIPGNLRRAP